MYKLISFDLDGTFLDKNKNIPEINLEALEEAGKKGIELVPATGRLYAGIPAEISSIPGIRYYILINGAKVYDAKEDKTIFTACISREMAVSLMEYAETMDCIYDAYIDDCGYMNRDMYDRFEQYVNDPVYMSYMKSIRTPVKDLKEMIRSTDCHVQKTQFFFKDLNKRSEQLKVLPELFKGIKVSSSLGTNLEINSQEAGKGTALEELCRALGVQLCDTVAFGDGLNDKEMLEKAGLGIAMANSDEGILKMADKITDDNNSGGVGKAIFELF